MSGKILISEVRVYNWLLNLVEGRHSEKVSPKEEYLYGNLRNEWEIVRMELWG